MVSLILKGISELMPLALLMMLAFSISHVCNSLGTGEYVAGVTEGWLSPRSAAGHCFCPFLLYCFLHRDFLGNLCHHDIHSHTHGPDARCPTVLVVAATMGGGVFGDHCSPISDTTIISSMSSASDHIDHVPTQLPYALVTGVITVLLYLILGFAMNQG